jgi:hypothetical protein
MKQSIVNSLICCAIKSVYSQKLRQKSHKNSSAQNTFQIKMKQAEEDFQEFLNECFTPDGNYIFKEYPKTVSDKSCKWCPYSNNGMCDKGQKKPEIFSKERI